jgi:hypothetical protein
MKSCLKNQTNKKKNLKKIRQTKISTYPPVMGWKYRNTTDHRPLRSVSKPAAAQRAVWGPAAWHRGELIAAQALGPTHL